MTLPAVNLSNWKRMWAFVAIVFILSRLLNFAAFTSIDHYYGNERGGFEAQIHAYFFKWDSAHYRKISNSGYSLSDETIKSGQTQYAFYPLMPLLVRGFSEVTGISTTFSGIILANIFFFFALGLFGYYCRLRSNDSTTVRAMLLLAFCPENFFFSAFYTESLFLFLTLAAWLSFDRKRTSLSALSAALLTATRSNGIFVVLYFGYKSLLELIRLIREKSDRKKMLRNAPPYLLPIVFAPLGLFAYWWFCYTVTGDAFAQKTSASYGWNVRIGMPFQTLFSAFGKDFNNTFWLTGALIFLAFTFTIPMRKLFGDFLYSLANMLLFFSNSIAQSAIRYAIVIFPIYLGLAIRTERRPLLFLLLLVSFIAANLYLCHAWIIGDKLPI